MRVVADQFAEVLANVGVKRIYGSVGDSLNGLTDAIRRQVPHAPRQIFHSWHHANRGERE